MLNLVAEGTIDFKPTSFWSLTDNASDLVPSSENAFPRASPSQAPRSFTALLKSDSDCPNSDKKKKNTGNHITRTDSIIMTLKDI
jgi:hypothetical protein